MDEQGGGASRRQGRLERMGLVERTIVHFDVREGDQRTRRTIQRYLHGRVDRKGLARSEKVYRYPGLLHEGGFRLGQSVYMFPPDLASRFIIKLRELGVRPEWRDVYVPG